MGSGMHSRIYEVHNYYIRPESCSIACNAAAMLKPVLLHIQINLNIQQVLKKVLIITFVRAAADAAGNAFGPPALPLFSSIACNAGE
jgi:hypothetical protein